MESKKEEALIAKHHAEKRFADKDFAGAKNFALKAQMLFPELEGISQMVTTFGVYVASESRVNGEIDFYSVLGLKPSADRAMVKKQFKKLATLLHPDKNKTVGADGAFRLVTEAWAQLSDKVKKASYDLKRNMHFASFPDNCGDYFIPPTFWTVCTSCQVQYEYLRKYVNKRLSCKNCRGTFMAVELATAPVDSAYTVSQSQWSFAPENGHNSHAYGNFPGSTVTVLGNGISTRHSGHGSEYVSNGSFRWSPSSGGSVGTFGQSNGYKNKPGRKPRGDITRPYKQRKVHVGGSAVNGNASDENGCRVPNFSIINGSTVSQQIPPPVDIRTLLIEKARTSILKKLAEIKLGSMEKTRKSQSEAGKFEEIRKKSNLGFSHLEFEKLGPVTLTVPDSDFHDFDKDRTEECFQPKQIWALYDEEDGMPRIYCLIRQILSTNPFKIHISYLGSKTDTEFGAVNWIDSGFTKSCGHFRAMNSEIVQEVNVFSHPLTREKAGRGGCVRIFPRTGDIWAVYRNWSPDWNRLTPYNLRHQYEMVEILNDYDEDYGVYVTPLVKVEGYKTVYRRKTGNDVLQWVPRREMFRFSHPVPSWLIKDAGDLHEECWDLDPAATPDDLLQPVNGMEAEEKR
ncbi:hypothetical protein RND81_11G090200 [Saponaria officinalis]|uniref:J domain-containing protein n=1 Tax=Saponaria officinalis TaxID=3572 RepID=A0AAW1HIS8_SAPOF